jgi:hypothetical protein
MKTICKEWFKNTKMTHARWNRKWFEEITRKGQVIDEANAVGITIVFNRKKKMQILQFIAISTLIQMQLMKVSCNVQNMICTQQKSNIKSKIIVQTGRLSEHSWTPQWFLLSLSFFARNQIRSVRVRLKRWSAVQAFWSTDRKRSLSGHSCWIISSAWSTWSQGIVGSDRVCEVWPILLLEKGGGDGCARARVYFTAQFTNVAVVLGWYD